jgi:hypothetical protein
MITTVPDVYGIVYVTVSVLSEVVGGGALGGVSAGVT